MEMAQSSSLRGESSEGGGEMLVVVVVVDVVEIHEGIMTLNMVFNALNCHQQIGKTWC